MFFECFTSKFLIFIIQYIQFSVHLTFLENGHVNTPQELFRHGSIELYFLFFGTLMLQTSDFTKQAKATKKTFIIQKRSMIETVLHSEFTKLINLWRFFRVASDKVKNHKHLFMIHFFATLFHFLSIYHVHSVQYLFLKKSKCGIQQLIIAYVNILEWTLSFRKLINAHVNIFK
jgi:hypothetical protein